MNPRNDAESLLPEMPSAVHDFMQPIVSRIRQHKRKTPSNHQITGFLLDPMKSSTPDKRVYLLIQFSDTTESPELSRSRINV